nr:hypothetical protein BC332_00664 [Ipomoea trifida]
MVLSIETSPEMTSSSKTPSAAVGSTSIASSSSSPISTRNRPLQRWPTEYFWSQWKHRPLSRLSRISAEVYFLMGKPEVAWAVGAGKNLGTPVPPSVVVAGCEVGTDRIVTCEKLVPLDCHRALRFRRLVEVEVFLDIEDPLMRIFSSKLRDIQPHTVVFRHPGCSFGIFSIHSLTSCRVVCHLASMEAIKLVGSKATFYKQPDGMGTPDGACGYKDYGRTVNDGAVCTVSNKLFNNGAGCGSCYNVICTNKALCSSTGTKVVATDNGGGPAGSDFICSYLAFTKLAKPGKESELVKKGVIDVVYEKVACNYPKNLIIKITDQSSNPGYLSFAVLNQGDVLSAEVYDMVSQGWTSMRRVYGAVFDLANPPEGALKVRFTIGKVYGGTTLVYSKKWIPENWRAGRTIDTGIHL